MPKMTFRGVRIIDWKGCHTETGQFIELNMEADFSDKVREAMGCWDISEELESLLPGMREQNPKGFDRAAMLLPKGIKSIGLDGDIAVTSLDLIPNGKDLSKHELSLECTRISWFSLQRVKQPNGSHVWGLRYTAIIQGTGAARKIEGYIAGVGDNVAQMQVGYNKQEDLPLDKAEDEPDDRQERLISEEQAADTAEADEDDRGPALAPAAMVGGTHQRGNKQKHGRRGAEQIPDPVEAVQ